MKNKHILRLRTLLLIIIVAFAASCSSALDTHTEEQKEFVSSSYVTAGNIANGTEEKSRPLPIELTLGKVKEGYTLVIAKKSGEVFVRARLDGGSKYQFYNSELNTEYVWHIEDENGKKTGRSGNFTTAHTVIRNLYIDGVTNCRDLGGWKTVDGRRIKQGLLYRTGRFNEGGWACESNRYITDEGIDMFVNTLGVKTEIDLRTKETGEAPAVLKSALGESVKYVQVSMRTNGDYLKFNKEKLAEVFEVFADKDNYPIVFHCSIGTDRTGVIAFLVNALLGVEKDSLYYDYLFSNFGYIGKNRSFTQINDYLKEIKTAGGDTIAENAYNYLVKYGVSTETLDFMREFLVE